MDEEKKNKMATELKDTQQQDLHKTESQDDTPIEEVRLTVPTTDDPSLPVLTFRTWVLGIASCTILSFMNQFFAYRTNPLFVSSVSAQIIVLPVGRFMAATLPSTRISIPGTKWGFSLNPGPFNIKEHVLITIFANAGANVVYGVLITTIIRVFYHRQISPTAAFLLTQTTQMLGYGWAGLFRKLLVDSPYMWWPANMVNISLFRALHEKEKRSKGGLSRLQFFVVVLTCSFAYYVIPNLFFPYISYISIACLLWKNSVTAQQLGSGIYGLGIGSFGLDWSTVAGFLSSPLATPAFAIMNFMVGFVVFACIIVPIAYWSDMNHAKRFQFYTSHIFDWSGNKYNISRVLNATTFEFDEDGYNGYSKVYMSIFFALSYGFSFATLSATISHVTLFHGREILRMTTKAFRVQTTDIHTRIMKKNYETVPQKWFFVILVSTAALSFLTCLGFGGQLQLPWWGVIFSCLIALLFTLPIGIIQATTNMQPGLSAITELIIGYIYPGHPLANVTFKTYGYISMSQALTFLSDFKLGHYMKIPPRAMFVAQFVSTLVASTVYFGTSWWLLDSVKDICQGDSRWSCPVPDVFYNASIIWGVIGPKHMFGRLGEYLSLNWFFLVGLLLPVPVWFMTRIFPQKKWIYLVNMPVLLSAATLMPPTRSANFVMWGLVGLIFNLYVYKRYKTWWARNNYVLSAGLDAGLAFMAILIYFTLQYPNPNWSSIDWWGGDSAAEDRCPLAKCPTAPGIINMDLPYCHVH